MCLVTEQCEWGCRWYCGNKIKQVCFKMLLLGLFLPNRLGSKEKRKWFHLKCIALTHPGAARADSHFMWHLKPCEDWDAFFFSDPFSEFFFFFFFFLRKEEETDRIISEDLGRCFSSWLASYPFISWNRKTCWEEVYKRQSPPEASKDGRVISLWVRWGGESEEPHS